MPKSIPIPDPLPRRAALGLLAAACAGLLTGGASGPDRRPRRRLPHPDPRPGIDASRILPAERVAEYPDAVSAFDEARAIPGILDGLRCQCGCGDRPGKRSVLSCYEDDGMALDCEVCRGVTRLAYRLDRKGRTLAEIRDAVDARYGV